MSISEELRQAAEWVRSEPVALTFAEHLADWLDHTADNMDDEEARVVTGDCVDGGTYIEVVTDSHSHVGLSAEWTAALLTARRINGAQETIAPVVPTAQRVSEERVQEILDGLNAFVAWEFDGGTHIVNGAARPCAEVVGCDANLDKAVDWALEQNDVAIACGPDTDGSAEIELDDGTVIVWQQDRKCWAVTVSDDTECEAAR